MAGLAEELDLVVAPGLNGALGVARRGIAARAVEELLFGLALWQQLGHEPQNENSRKRLLQRLFPSARSPPYARPRRLFLLSTGWQ